VTPTVDADSISLATRLLVRMDEGDDSAGRELYELLHTELHRRARGFMRDQGPEHTLQATALVNEVWLKLAQGGPGGWDGRRHFLGVATRAMRSVLVDHARARATRKRSAGRQRVDLGDVEPAVRDDAGRIVALDETLERLAASDPDGARVAEMRVFGGLEHSEIAVALGVSTRTVERAWKRVRDVLRDAVDDG